MEMENEVWREKCFPNVKLAFFPKRCYPAASLGSIADSTGTCLPLLPTTCRELEKSETKSDS